MRAAVTSLINGLALVLCASAILLVPPSAARGDLPESLPKASFFTSRSVVWLGRTQVLPFRAALPAGSDSTFIAAPSDPSVLEVLRQPAILAGETTGYLRLRALKTGTTRLSFPGGAAIDLEVRADPTAAAYSQIETESRQPRIVSPMPGAVVWDKFVVGVEIFDNTLRAQAHDQFHVTDAAPAPEIVKVQLRLPDGRMLDPMDAGPAVDLGPVRRLAFEVNTADLRPGPFRLTAVALAPVSNELDRRTRPTSPVESDPLPLVFHAPAPNSLWADEAENSITDPKEVLAPARPARYGTRQPKVDKDVAASGGQVVSCYGPEPAWCLPFIVKNPGDYQLVIRARGDFGVGAYPTVALRLNSFERPTALVRLASNKYERLPVGTPFHLDAGPQLLNLQFVNDAQHGKEDRNFYLDRYELQRVGDSGAATQPGAAPLIPPAPLPRDKPPLAASAAAQALGLINAPAVASLLPANDLPPRVGILYPANGASVHGADAVVAFVENHARTEWVDLLVDGQPQNLRRLNPLPGEAMLFPLLARGLTPGSHRLSVRAADHYGHYSDSSLQLLTVLPDAPKQPAAYERAVRLLSRFGFGPEPKELAAVLTLGETTWLNNRLGSGFDTPAEQALLHIACTRYPQSEDSVQTPARALTQWIGSENPVRARFTGWVENHFTTWIEKATAFPQWRQHLSFCRLGVAPFADLLNASSQSPAMLTYLDQERSFAGHLNENYAREIMELHTLGVHGGYAQADVTSLAFLLNGWTLAEEATLLNREDGAELKLGNRGERTGISKGLRFVPVLNNGKAQRVFGMNFPAAEPAARYDRIRLAIEMLASHPQTADHVCRKLAEHYVGTPAPDDLVHDMAVVFMESGGDPRPVLRAMACHPSFWSVEPKVATPLDFGIREARLCRAAISEIGGDPDQATKPEVVASFLKRSGMGLFDHISPDGYPQNSAAYSDSNALLQRWRFVQSQAEALNRVIPPHWRPVLTATATPTGDAGNTNASPGADQIQRFVDLAAVRLTGRLLSAESNKAALELLNPDPSPAMMRQIVVFVSMLPENNLR